MRSERRRRWSAMGTVVAGSLMAAAALTGCGRSAQRAASKHATTSTTTRSTYTSPPASTPAANSTTSAVAPSSTSTSAATTSTATQSSTTSTSSTTAAETSKVWTWSNEPIDGITTSFNLETGSPERVTSVEHLLHWTGVTQVEHACPGFNPQADALIPVQFTESASNPEYEASAIITDENTSPVITPGVKLSNLQMVNLSYNSDSDRYAATCSTGTPINANDFYLVVHNYFEPDSSGRQTDLGDISLVVSGEGSQGSVVFDQIDGEGAELEIPSVIAISLDGRGEPQTTSPGGD
jgi:hypothetical protein